MDQNKNITPSSNVSNSVNTVTVVRSIPPQLVMLVPNRQEILYHLSTFSAARPSNDLQMPLDLNLTSKAPTVQSTGACDNAVSRTRFQSSEKPAFVIGPAFSLTNDHKVSNNLHSQNVSAAESSNNRQTSTTMDLSTFKTPPFCTSVPTTLHWYNVPISSAKPNISKRSVFSLSGEHTKAIDQNIVGSGNNFWAVGSNVSQKATELVGQVSTPSTTINHFPYKPCLYKNGTTGQSDNPHIEKPKSPEQALKVDSEGTTNNSCTSRTKSAPLRWHTISSTVDSAADTLLTSHKQQDLSEVISNTGANKVATIESDIPISNQDSQALPHVTAKEPEVVDLDTEDVDDCMLVKIDLRKHFIPFGLQIHNTEVVIHDSDTDDNDDCDNDDDNNDDVTGLMPEVDDQIPPSNNGSGCHSRSLSSAAVVHEPDSPESAVCSTNGVTENGTCELIGSLSMEVEEINSEPDALSKSSLQQTLVSSSYVPKESLTAPINGHQNDALSTSFSVMNSHVGSDVMNTDKRYSSCHLISVPKRSSLDDTSDPDFELMELHVDDETPVSIQNENKQLKVITPSKFALTEKNVSVQVPQSDVSVSLITSTSCIPSNTTGIDTGEQSGLSDAASQVEISKNHQPFGITSISSPYISKENTTTSKNKLKPAALTLAQLLQAESPNKLQRRVKQIISVTNNPKQPSTKISEIVTGVLAAQTNMKPKDTSVMCKLCFSLFPSRMDLVTHTWNTHRQPVNEKQKCGFCDKSFPNSALLRLHHKINCSKFHETGKVADTASKTSIIHNLLRRKISTVGNSTRDKDTSAPLLRVGSSGLKESGKHQKKTLEKRSGTDVISVPKYMASVGESLNTEPQVKDSHLDCNKRLEQLSKPSPLRFAASSDNEAEQEDQDVEPNISFSPVVEKIPAESLLHNDDGRPNDKARFKHPLFPNQPELNEHQTISDGLSASKNVKCFICELTFTDSFIRYHHMWNHPRCFDGINKYCSKCCSFFNNPSDKQAHLSLSKPCWLLEMQLIKKGIAGQGNIQGDVVRNGMEIRVSSLAQGNVLFSQENVPLQDKDTFKVTPIQSANRKSLNEIKRHRIPLKNENTQEKLLETLVPENVNTDQNVHCMTCKAKFSSHAELLDHYIEEKKCSATISVKANSPRPKANSPRSKVLKAIPSLVSIVCKVCHLPFTDESKLAEHVQLSHNCPDPEKIHKDIESFSVNETKKKRVKKYRSCKIASGISSSTCSITLVEGRMSLPEQPLVDQNFMEKNLNQVTNLPINNIQVLNSINKDHLSLTSQQSDVDVKIKERQNEDNNGAPKLPNSNTTVWANPNVRQVCETDVGYTGGNGEFSDVSTSDCEFDIEGDNSPSEEDAVEYECKLCSKTFTQQSLFVKHTKSHDQSSRRKNVQCKVCTRKFQHLTDLQAHLLQFQYCFIPLTRKLWENKQIPKSCNMCKKSVHSSKDLRKHCFKNMACRLRYVKLLLKKLKKKDISNNSVLSSSESSATQFPMSGIQKEVSESNKGNGEVSSSVPDCENLKHSDNQSSIQTNGDRGTTIATASSTMPALLECLSCGNTFTDFLGHLLEQQACLDFYGIYTSKCPVPLPFCYQCKQCFDSIAGLTKHACPGFVPYTYTCSACKRKFTSGANYNAHIKVCSKMLAFFKQSRNPVDENLTSITNPLVIQQQDSSLPAPKADDVAIPYTGVKSGVQSFPCLICDERFPLLRLLMQHSYTHEEETALTCDRCGTMFVHYNQFVSHQTFHIRMDKQNGVLPRHAQPIELNSVLKVGSPSSSYIDSSKDSEVSPNLMVCLFCHQNFPNKSAKTDHLANAPACLGIMRCIVENKFFICDNESCKIKSTDPNRCDFCHQSYPDLIYHFVQSVCFNMLEIAILRFRANSSHKGQMMATQSTETASAGSMSSSAATNTHPFIKSQSLCCPVCKVQFDDQNLLSSHQRKMHGGSSDIKSPSESNTKGTVDEPVALYCLACSKCLQTVKEVKQHNIECEKASMVLPINAAVHADWGHKCLRCKLCDTRYQRESSLINHMICKHYHDDTSALLKAAGHATILCAICNQDILLLKIHSHFQQYKKIFLKGLRKLPVNVQNDDKVACIFCNLYFSREAMQEHVNKHTYSCILSTDNQSTAKSASKQKSSDIIQKKDKQKVQKLETETQTTEAPLSAVRCKICYRIVINKKEFKSHFRVTHTNYDKKTWAKYFRTVNLLESKKEHMKEAGKCHNSAKPTYLAEDSSSSKGRKSVACDSVARQSYVDANSPFNSTNKTSQTLPGYKIAHLRPIGSCKICFKEFVNYHLFTYHLKTQHSKYAPGDKKKYFLPVSPLGEGSITETRQQISTAGSHDNLCRVCLICQASYRDASLYQAHLKTHLVQCKVILEDFNKKSVCTDSEEENVENFLYPEVKIEYD